jgi:glycosyltransferase involved in cell wall biosynthesis
VVENGVAGFVDTEPARLADRMRDLLRDPGLARRLGEGARRFARERFDIRRFARDWDHVIRLAAGRASAGAVAATSGGTA